MRTKILILLILFLIFIIPETLSLLENDSPTNKSSKEVQENSISQKTFVKVIKIIDGDTIQIEGGEKVRYIGIDTPETVDPRKPVGCFGEEASKKNKELVEGKIIKMEKDISETDRYGRLLRYVWIRDIFVNDYLIRQGFATAATFPPDVKYEKQFREAEKEAREKGLGLWSSCQ